MKKIFFGINLVIASFCATAQNFTETIKAVASDRQSGNQFGSAVSISGNYAVVGAADISDGQMPNSAQCAYVYERNAGGNWAQVQKLTDSDKAGGDNFGQSVSISGNYIIIGSPKHSKDANGGNILNSAGAAYVFERNASGVWVEIKKLIAGDRSAGDNFGYSVSVSGNNFIVGAPFDDKDDQGSNSLPNAGSVYFFSRHIVTGNWFLINKMVAYDRAEGAGFGFSVSISGIYAVVGAPYESKDTTGANIMQSAGAAYIFQRPGDIGGWSLVHKIVYWNRAVADNFGYAVAIRGDVLIVGAPFEDEDANQINTLLSAGSAHIFERKGDYGWWWIAALVAPDRATGDNFGQSVSITKDMVVVGAPVEDENITGGNTMTSSGSAYIFRMNYDSLSSGWRFLQKITAPDRTANDWFGYAVAISDNNAIIGAPFQDKDSKGIAVNDAGAIYFFGQKPCIPTTSSIAPRACRTYASPSNKYTWTSSGTYIDTIKNKAGCDSIININLTVIYKADTSVTITGNTITANAKQANFMWIDCSTNGIMRVPTLPSFTPTVSGSYAVHVNQSNCIGVSSCYTINVNSSVISNPPKNPLVNPTPQSNSVLKEFVEMNKLVPADRHANDQFGQAVSISGNYAVIGVPVEDEDANGTNTMNDAGSVYIFEKGSDGKWKQVQKIVASDRTPGDNFGWAVGISGNYIVVGALYEDENVAGGNTMSSFGSAYIFERNTNGAWNEVQKIVASHRSNANYFGTSVAIDGNTIVVGSNGHSYDETDRLESNINDAGALFVFERTDSGWTQTQKIVANDHTIANLGDGLGISVSICGNYIIAGAMGADVDANGGNRMETAGAVYIFERTGIRWKQVQKIVANDRAPFDEFGCSVAISGDNVIIGARRKTETTDPNSKAYTGNAYIFSRKAAVGRTRPNGGVILTPEADGKWRQVLKINPDDRKGEDRLGWSVAMCGDYAIVGATGQDSDSLGNYMPDGGAIYVYYQDKRNNWSQSGKLATLDRSTLDNFGYAVAISDCNIIGGTIIDNEDAEDKNAKSNAGSAYIFTAASCGNSSPCNSPERILEIKNPKPGIITPKLNLDTVQTTPLIKGPKKDSVKMVSSYNFNNVRICLDIIKTDITLPPRTEKPFYYSVPEINPDGTLKTIGVIKQELAAYTDKMWSPGEVLKVGFFNDAGATTFIIDKIKMYAKEWEKYANIKFEFVDRLSQAQIKIGFAEKNKSWSLLGRDLLFNPFGAATMNFGWFTNESTEKDFRVTIMHEFGHALGFVHEHQSPAAGINWDKEKVYAFFAQEPNKWSRAEVDAQVFSIYNKTSLNYSAYDPFSIMHYFFPVGLTTDGTAFPDIDYISGNDIKYAKLLYPFPPTPKNPTGTLHTTDDCDEIDFTVEYNAVDTNVIDFILEPGSTNGKRVTWWKRIGIPSKGGVDIDMEIENGSVSNKKIPVEIIDKEKGISFSKAKLFGIHTPLNYKWNVMPALIGGCRVRLTWRRDTCL